MTRAVGRTLVVGIATAVVASLFASAGASAGVKPTRVVAQAVVAQTGPTSPTDPTPTDWATVRIDVKAYDIDPSDPVCSTCPTGDLGWAEVSKEDPNDPRPAFVASGPINWVDLDPAVPKRASVSVGTILITLVDGNPSAGEPDSVRIGSFLGGSAQGTLLQGHIRIT